MFLTCVKSQEVKLLVSPPKLASGNCWPENMFRHRVSAGKNTKTRPREDDGFGQLIPLCREYTLCRAHPQYRVFAAIPGGTSIGPVIEDQIVKILDQCGLEIAIPSPNDHERTSYVVISRGKSRFVDEVHIPDAVLRPSPGITHWTSKIRRKRVLRRTDRYKHPGDWFNPCFK